MSSSRNRPHITIGLAQTEDDPSLRSLLREMPMPGDIRLSFRREPDFFKAAQVEGRKARVIVGRTSDGEIVGMGTRAEKLAYLNGQIAYLGYLSSLRLRPQYRSLTLLGQGFQVFRKLHAQGKTKLYLATITADNQRAEKVLTSGRAGLPYFQDQGELHTLAIRPARKITGKKAALFVRPAERNDMDKLLNFLHEHGKRRQFFPRYAATDFEYGLLQGLKLSDILLAFEGREIVGSLGFWDQRAYKQNMVQQYSQRLRRMKWAYNIFAALSGRPFLPRERGTLNLRTGAICCIKDDKAATLRALLQQGLNQTRFKELHSFVIGFHEKDPLLKCAQAMPHHIYKSRLYVIHWADGREAYRALDQRVPYVELGGL